jgi:hypothetical protein
VNYARVDIEDNNGNIQSSTPIYCPAQSGCSFKANMPAAGSLLFYDKNNTMVNAYILVDPPSDVAFVTTSKDMLGIYLLSAYNNSTPDIDILVDGVRLLNFFQNYANTGLDSDIPNDLGPYYQSQVIGTGLSYQDFISNLNTQLQNGAVLAPNLFTKNDLSLFDQLLAFFKNTPMIQSAYANDWNPICSSAFQQAKQIAGALPIGNLVAAPWGSIINLGLPIIESTCKKPDGTTGTIQALSDKLDQLQASWNTSNGKLEALLNISANNTTNSSLSTMKEKINSLKDYVNLYQFILIGNGNAKQPQYANLKDFVTKNGGSIEAAYSNNVKFKTLLDDLNSNYWKSYRTLIGQNKGDFATALQAICVADNNGKTSTQDMVQQRIACNGRIALWKNYITAASGQASSLLPDLFAMLDAANPADKEFIRSKTQLIYLDGQNSSSSWMDNYNNYAVTRVINPALESAITGFANSNAPQNDPNSGFFLMTDGLPTDLITNLKSLKCTNPEDGSVAIMQAFLNGNNTNPVSSIVVFCPNGNGTNLSASKYYYLKDGNNIRNVLGVVVPATEPQNRNSSKGIDPTRGSMQNTLTIYQSQNIIAAAFANKTTPITLDFKNGQAQINFPTAGDNFAPNSLYLNYTDSSNLKLSWVWTLRADNGQTGGLNFQRYKTFIIDCLSSTCGLGASDNAIGFGRAGGPDPIIFNTDNFINSFKLP